MKNYIVFKKQRDLGELLGDTFGFLRQEFKPFFKIFFNVAGPALFISLIAFAAYSYLVGDVFSFNLLETNNFNMVSPFIIISAAFIYILSAMAAYVYAVTATLGYIKSYIDNDGQARLEDVKQHVKNYFWGITGLALLKGITLVFAMLLCILPVFYAMIPMAVVYSIYIFGHNTSAMDAFGNSFKLVNNDFWNAFGTFIILGILFYVLSMVFSIPAAIYTWIKMGVFSGEVDPTNLETLSDPFYIFLNVINTLVQFLLNIILFVGATFIYFHLNEKENFTGTLERIDNIGENPTS